MSFNIYILSENVREKPNHLYHKKDEKRIHFIKHKSSIERRDIPEQL